MQYPPSGQNWHPQQPPSGQPSQPPSSNTQWSQQAQYPSQYQLPLPDASYQPQILLYCPRCQEMDRVQKVSAIVNAGTASGNYTGFADGVGYSANGPVYMNEYIALSGNSQTSLGRLLSPPHQPTYNRSLGFWSVGALGILWIVLAFILLTIITNFQAMMDGYGIAALICAGLISLIYYGHNNRVSKERAWAESQMPGWQRVMAKWNSLYYCHRCDSVFIPGQSRLIAPVRVKNYLYEV